MTRTTSPTRCTSCGCNAVQPNGFCNWCGHDHNPPVTRCLVEMDYYFGRHTGTVEVVVDVQSPHEPGTKDFESDALQAGYNHGDAGMFCVAGCNGLRVTVVAPDAELTPERDGEPDYS